MTSPDPGFCRGQHAYPLPKGDLVIHSFLRAYTRWTPADGSKVQIMMLKGLVEGDLGWSVVTSYGDGYAEPEIDFGDFEADAFLYFLSRVTLWASYDDPAFADATRTRRGKLSLVGSSANGQD